MKISTYIFTLALLLVVNHLMEFAAKYFTGMTGEMDFVGIAIMVLVDYKIISAISKQYNPEPE